MVAALTLVYNAANAPERMALRKVCKLRADHAIPRRWDDVRVYFAVRQGLRAWRRAARQEIVWERMDAQSMCP